MGSKAKKIASREEIVLCDDGCPNRAYHEAGSRKVLCTADGLSRLVDVPKCICPGHPRFMRKKELEPAVAQQLAPTAA